MIIPVPHLGANVFKAEVASDQLISGTTKSKTAVHNDVKILKANIELKFPKQFKYETCGYSTNFELNRKVHPSSNLPYAFSPFNPELKLASNVVKVTLADIFFRLNAKFIYVYLLGIIIHKIFTLKNL